MKHSCVISTACLLLVLLMFGAVPCAAAEDAFNPWKTLPTEDCNLTAYSTPNQSPLYEKSAVFFGDSICNAKTDTQLGYAGRIGTKYNMTFYKEGYSGAAFSTVRGSNMIGSQINAFRAAHPNETIDYVILEGGTNDAWDQATLGKISKSYKKKDFDPSTFAGAVETAIFDVKESFPNATIGFIIIYKMPIAYYDGVEVVSLRDNAKMEPYMNTIIEACEKWEIPYLDLYHDDAFNNTVFQTNTNEYLSDGIHMTTKGYDVISKYIAAWMENPVRRQAPPQTPIQTPNIDLSEPTESTPSEQPSEHVETPPVNDPKPTNNVGKIVAIAAGAAVGVAAIATGVILALKKKKK